MHGTGTQGYRVELNGDGRRANLSCKWNDGFGAEAWRGKGESMTCMHGFLFFFLFLHASG